VKTVQLSVQMEIVSYFLKVIRSPVLTAMAMSCSCCEEMMGSVQLAGSIIAS